MEKRPFTASVPAIAQPLSPAAAITRRHDRDRFQTALFAPAARREALFALYAFNYEIARVREAVTQPTLGPHPARMVARKHRRRVMRGAPLRRHPVAEALTLAIRERGADAGPFRPADRRARGRFRRRRRRRPSPRSKTMPRAPRRRWSGSRWRRWARAIRQRPKQRRACRDRLCAGRAAAGIAVAGRCRAGDHPGRHRRGEPGSIPATLVGCGRPGAARRRRRDRGGRDGALARGAARPRRGPAPRLSRRCCRRSSRRAR